MPRGSVSAADAPVLPVLGNVDGQTKDVLIEILRRDTPEGQPYRERFAVPHEPDLNVIACLRRIAARPVTVEGKKTTPVAFDSGCLEEVCGACSMLINGRVRQACTALVDRLLVDTPDAIRLEPMTKFPPVRDLVVDRRRVFDALKRVEAWIEVDGYHDRGPGPRVSEAEQENHYPLSRCMSCGCCLEACPQFNDRTQFIGPHAVSQVVMFNGHPTGKLTANQRLEALLAPGGLADCGNAQNCVKVCPKEIPLTESIARAGWEANVYAIKRWLRR